MDIGDWHFLTKLDDGFISLLRQRPRRANPADFNVDPKWAKERRIEYLENEIPKSEGKRQRRLQAELTGLENNTRLPQWKIEYAGQFPLEELVETKHNRIRCPIHKGEDRNMLVKNGYGYCFVCNKSLNSINYMMLVRGMSFVDAVNVLAEMDSA